MIWVNYELKQHQSVTSVLVNQTCSNIVMHIWMCWPWCVASPLATWGPAWSWWLSCRRWPRWRCCRGRWRRGRRYKHCGRIRQAPSSDSRRRSCGRCWWPPTFSPSLPLSGPRHIVCLVRSRELWIFSMVVRREWSGVIRLETVLPSSSLLTPLARPDLKLSKSTRNFYISM